MPRRRRWSPVKGTGNRVYDARERLLLRALDLPGRALFGLRRAAPRAPDPTSAREVLVLRLDRIGDVIMSLPALHDLRAALPSARVRLAVGRWSEEVARRAPVDEVLVWSAPWVGRAEEGADSWAALAARARASGGAGVDLALDLQGDVRANLLLRLTGSRRRVGYANTGGAYLLTDVVPLDETVSWVEQNRRAVEVAVPGARRVPTPALVSEGERARGRRILEEAGARGGPRVGIHPSGGRLVKEWPAERWNEVATRLQRALGATIVLTGSAADRDLAARVAAGLPWPAVDLTGRLGLGDTIAAIGALDLFLSPDTGPMHVACAAGTPAIAVFGPSDPVRYFSAPPEHAGSRHLAVHAELWCAPCNLIRRPPRECAHGAPECLRLVSPEAVYAAAARLLGAQGFATPAAAARP